jgi:hypothetical protein
MKMLWLASGVLAASAMPVAALAHPSAFWDLSNAP